MNENIENNPVNLPDTNKILENIERKRGRPKKTTLVDKDTETNAKKTSKKIDEKYYSAEIWGEVVNLPNKIFEMITKYPEWQFDKEQKLLLGEQLGLTIKLFFPNLEEDDAKYIVLIGFISTYLGIMGLKGAECKTFMDQMKKQKQGQ